MSRVHAMRGGRDNDPCFGSRMVGDGKLAELLGKRFEIASKRIGFNERQREFDTALFRVPESQSQLALF
jgi:DNA repair photolyase